MEELKTYPRWAQFLPHLLRMEGRGDDVTDVPTGLAGMTMKTYGAMRKDLPKGTLPAWTDKDKPPPDEKVLTASKAYANKIYRDYSTPSSSNYLEGFMDLPSVTQDMIISSAYNMGEGFHKNAPSFTRAVKDNNSMEAANQLLDTANTENAASMGLARRRAQERNAVAKLSGQPLIEEIVQTDVGIDYRTGINNLGESESLFSYVKPRHSTSPAGVMKHNPKTGVWSRLQREDTGV
jgi:GH24 family phage-related lysozyme (muramidase)